MQKIVQTRNRNCLGGMDLWNLKQGQQKAPHGLWCSMSITCPHCVLMTMIIRFQHFTLSQGTATEEQAASWGRHLGVRISRIWRRGNVKHLKKSSKPKIHSQKTFKKNSAFFRFFPPFSRVFPPFSGFGIFIFFLSCMSCRGLGWFWHAKRSHISSG